MNQQCFAFDAPARISRKSDPITSQKSAAETEKQLPLYQQQLLSVLVSLLWNPTAREAARIAASRFSGMEDTYRKRMLDLVRNGKAVECGERPCEVTGKSAMTFRVKEQQ
jgi:hypothetical protein